MAKENKSILEEALLDAKRIQEALNANTKEILRSVAREEIDGLVKESLNEEDFEIEDADDAEDNVPTEDGSETTGEEIPGDDTDLEPVATGDETSELGDLENGDETGMDMGMSDMGDEIDMTSASDEDVIAVYKKLTGNDEIEVVGNDIHLTVSEPGEYVIKTKGEMGPIGDESSEEAIAAGDNEPEYEIALGDDEEPNEMEPADDDLEPVETGDESSDDSGEEKIEEKIVVGTGQAGKAYSDLTDIKGAGGKSRETYTESKNSNSKLLSETTEKYNNLLTESKQLKKENEEFRTSLKKFRNMLVETVVFNSNLTYVTKLFMEHSTTKDEKKGIIRRFDEEVSSLKESKKLYKTIANELTSKSTITETVDKKLNTEILTSTSKQLNESTAYIDKDTARIKDLINRVENKNN